MMHSCKLGIARIQGYIGTELLFSTFMNDFYWSNLCGTRGGHPRFFRGAAGNGWAVANLWRSLVWMSRTETWNSAGICLVSLKFTHPNLTIWENEMIGCLKKELGEWSSNYKRAFMFFFVVSIRLKNNRWGLPYLIINGAYIAYPHTSGRKT